MVSPSFPDENNGVGTRHSADGCEKDRANAAGRDFIRSMMSVRTGTSSSQTENGHNTDIGHQGVPDSINGDAISPPIMTRGAPQHRNQVTFYALQEWEGYVAEIDGEEFVARLADVTAGDEYETEEATIPIEELSLQDAKRLELGAFFRWVIGYERSVSGTKKWVSQIIFRDLPRTTKRDLEEAEAWAQRLSTFLNG